MEYRTDFPYDVDIVEDWIPLSDGTRLWTKMWRPRTDEPVPALLEYLPYRAGDWTAPRDHERHPYYAGMGYASIRVDIRGHGNSDGIPGDEYSPQEHTDALEVIDWIAAQDWCTGKLGMFGISWGGFNSLQVAALRPEPLKAIVTVCSTDDRYDNDVHYFGGSALAVDMHAWAATMLAFESRPPDIRVRPDDWYQTWTTRLEGMDTFIDRWLSHQTRDEQWRRGSVCEDYDAIDAAVMAVGGWFDPYRDTVLRLCEHLSALGKPVKGLIGPWEHQYPDRDLDPGPHIDFLGETLRWWDHWLRDDAGTPTDAGIMDEPLLRAWVVDPIPPSTHYEQMPGGWVAEDAWPSPAITPGNWDLGDAQVTPLAAVGEQDGRRTVRVRSPQDIGSLAGRYFPYGNAADLPPDQRGEDGKAVCFDTLLTEDVTMLGNAAVRLRLSSPTPRGQVYVRICDVAPDGSSTLVTRGNLNLSSRRGRDRVVEWPVGEFEDVEVPCTGMGYRFPAGHVLRVAVSSAYWPWVWPQPGGEGFTLDVTHGASVLELPVRPTPEAGSARAEADAAVVFDPPVQPVGLDVQYPEEGLAGARRPERQACVDVGGQHATLTVDPAYGGTRVYPDGLHYYEDTVERYDIDIDDPLGARTYSEWTVKLARPDKDWDTAVHATTRITCDADTFYTESDVECRSGEEIVFTRSWRREIPREAS